MEDLPTSLFGNEGKGLFGWRKLGWNLFVSSAAVIFGVVVLLLSIVAAANPAAIYPATESATMGAEMTATDEALPKMEYYLPYPGVLPDSPMYKIKMIRDRVALWLTFGEEKKARKELAYADKRINAAMYLVEGGKLGLGVTTATKAEKYLEKAVERVVRMSTEGQDAKSFLADLSRATQKHLEILEQLEGQVTGEDKKTLEKVAGATQVAGGGGKQAVGETK